MTTKFSDLFHLNNSLILFCFCVAQTVIIAKNRFRGDAHDTGYRDLNVVVAFEGFLCEIQVPPPPLFGVGFQAEE